MEITYLQDHVTRGGISLNLLLLSKLSMRARFAFVLMLALRHRHCLRLQYRVYRKLEMTSSIAVSWRSLTQLSEPLTQVPKSGLLEQVERQHGMIYTRITTHCPLHLGVVTCLVFTSSFTFCSHQSQQSLGPSCSCIESMVTFIFRGRQCATLLLNMLVDTGIALDFVKLQNIKQPRGVKSYVKCICSTNTS